MAKPRRASYAVTSAELPVLKTLGLEEVDPEEVFELQRKEGAGAFGRFLRECDHPNVVAFHGAYYKDGALWVAMEHCAGGSVGDIRRVRSLGEREISVIMRGALSGLAYLHSRRKIHRDVKGGNILLTGSGQVKIADFGVSAQLRDTLSRRGSFVGTPYWMSPELIQDSDYDLKPTSAERPTAVECMQHEFIRREAHIERVFASGEDEAGVQLKPSVAAVAAPSAPTSRIEQELEDEIAEEICDDNAVLSEASSSSHSDADDEVSTGILGGTFEFRESAAQSPAAGSQPLVQVYLAAAMRAYNDQYAADSPTRSSKRQSFNWRSESAVGSTNREDSTRSSGKIFVGDPFRASHDVCVKYNSIQAQYEGAPMSAEWAALHQQFGISLSHMRCRQGTHTDDHVPALIRMLRRELVRHGGLKCKYIYRVSPVQDEVQRAKAAINRGSFEPAQLSDPHVYASLLKLWLRELPVLLLDVLDVQDLAAVTKLVNTGKPDDDDDLHLVTTGNIDQVDAQITYTAQARTSRARCLPVASGALAGDRAVPPRLVILATCQSGKLPGSINVSTGTRREERRSGLFNECRDPKSVDLAAKRRTHVGEWFDRQIEGQPAPGDDDASVSERMNDWVNAALTFEAFCRLLDREQTTQEKLERLQARLGEAPTRRDDNQIASFSRNVFNHLSRVHEQQLKASTSSHESNQSEDTGVSKTLLNGAVCLATRAGNDAGASSRLHRNVAKLGERQPAIGIYWLCLGIAVKADRYRV
ncbi:Protein kinase-like domain [Phytophthora cactorum]|nr:Protein kinase-like domain [Phytophthora cactorum]